MPAQTSTQTSAQTSAQTSRRVSLRRALPALGFGAIVALGACTQPPTGTANLREASAAEVGACTYLTDIQMTPGVYGPLLAERGLANAYQKVRADAVQAGANTIVFDQATPGTQVYVVHAKAYRC